MLDLDKLYYLSDSHPERYTVLVLYNRGMPVREIARVLHKHSWTIYKLLRKTYNYVGLENSQQLLTVARKVGIV